MKQTKFRRCVGSVQKEMDMYGDMHGYVWRCGYVQIKDSPVLFYFLFFLFGDLI